MNYLKELSLGLIVLIMCIIILSCGKSSDEKRNSEMTGKESKNIIKADTISNNTNVHNGEIALDKLPTSVKSFVEKNFSGYHILTAVSDPLCQGGDAIDVSIEKTGSPKLSLIFKTDGSFVQSEEDVPLITAPDKVKHSLKTKFPDYKAGSQIEKLTMADKSIQYLFDLEKGKTTKEAIFSSDGTFVCEN